ncbi:hypothetical protein QQZ08_002098 [Neonectria magnoliae]|uniref:NmrA-like domain-containing protein n=1 Tax=Neonectria magnoliae TaxID=2732573 RepID=A0ABR1IER3_9HYPO
MADTLFITGAGGYITGTFLTIFAEAHPTTPIRALVRSNDQAERLRSFYAPKNVNVTPIVGSLDDSALLKAEAARASVVVQGCGDHLEGIMALLEGVSQHQKAGRSPTPRKDPVFVHISGSSNVRDPDLAFGDLLPRAYSDIDDLDEILAFGPERTHVTLENTIRGFSEKNNVKIVILAPPTILGHGAGALRTETYQLLWYNAIIENGASFLVGKGENVWSVVSVKDLGRAISFVVDEALKEGNGRLNYGRRGYYFIESFEVSLRERAQAAATRLAAQGLIKTDKVQLLPVEDVKARLGEFMPYLVGSSSRCRADGLKALGWTPQDLDWKPLIEEVGGKRA